MVLVLVKSISLLTISLRRLTYNYRPYAKLKMVQYKQHNQERN